MAPHACARRAVCAFYAPLIPISPVQFSLGCCFVASCLLCCEIVLQLYSYTKVVLRSYSCRLESGDLTVHSTPLYSFFYSCNGRPHFRPADPAPRAPASPHPRRGSGTITNVSYPPLLSLYLTEV